MNGMDDTAALVLLLSQNTVHTSPYSQKYLGALNLDPGKKLLSKCNGIWPHYDAVIQNRKKIILDLTLRAIAAKKSPQVVIFSSGLDALSLEIASRGKDTDVFEIDISHMEYKKTLFERVNPGICKRIRLITADIKKPENTVAQMTGCGFDMQRPSILIFEGISYYLPVENLFGLISQFRTGDQKNRLLLEYLVPEKDIASDVEYIPRKIYAMINDILPERIRFSRYSSGAIRSHLDAIGGNILETYTLRDMEKNRTGKNVHFRTIDCGWIEVCHAAI